MAEQPLVPILIAALLLIAGGLAALSVAGRARDAAPTVTVRQDPRRAARDAALVAGVRLAAELARCDGEVRAAQMDAIHDFLTHHVKRRDVGWAARVMRAGLHDTRSPESLEVAFVALPEMDQERLDQVLRLLVTVARADGQLLDAQRTFLLRVAERAGIEGSRIDTLLNEEA